MLTKPERRRWTAQPAERRSEFDARAEELAQQRQGELKGGDIGVYMGSCNDVEASQSCE